jgi:hypothetical protein
VFILIRTIDPDTGVSTEFPPQRFPGSLCPSKTTASVLEGKCCTEPSTLIWAILARASSLHR